MQDILPTRRLFDMRPHDMMAKRREELRKIVAARKAIEQELSSIDGEQDRIRKNLGGLDRTGELYARYLKKLDMQETQIEALQPQLAKLLEEERRAESMLEIDKPGGAKKEVETDPFGDGEENPFG